jgi:hypothetical protein
VIALANGMVWLKGLMISETGCSNIAAAVIVDKMKDLEMLWCEQNRIDG